MGSCTSDKLLVIVGILIALKKNIYVDMIY